MREVKFQRDLAGAWANWAKVSSAIRKAVPSGSVFTPEMMDCMAGLESTWDPKRSGPGGRTGLYQYNEATWAKEYFNTIPWSVESAQGVEVATAVALGGLRYRYEASVRLRPDRCPDQHLARAFSMFNGEERYGEYGYGNAILECARNIDRNFEAGYRAIWELTNRVP